MGKRKSSKKPVVKRTNEPLSTVFKCLFCHHEKSVLVKINKQSMFGSLNCKTCGQKFTTPINNLSVAVDVYCDWVDACDEINQKAKPKPKAVRQRSPEPAPRFTENEDEDEDDAPRRKISSRDYDSDSDDEDDRRARKVARRAYDDDDDDEDDD